jgi:hypothetical protein
MKSLSKIVGVLVVGFVGAANAEQVIVYQVPVDESNQQVSAEFEVNRELGRAWVDVGVQGGLTGSEPVFLPPIERHVDGLYYDSARKQVLYRTANGPIVCADDVGGTLKNTGNCRLTESTEQRSVDDGFDVRQEAVATVVLDAQTSTASAQAAASPR